MKALNDLSVNGSGEYKDVVSKNVSIIALQNLYRFGFYNVKDFYIMDSGNLDCTFDIIFYNKMCAESYIELYKNGTL